MRKAFKIFIICLCAPFAFALSLGEIEAKPKGVARDFYLYLYLQENSINAESALKIYNLIDNKIPKIMQFLKGKLPLSALPKAEQCRAKNFSELQKSDDECFNLGLKLDYASELKSKDLARITSLDIKKRIEILRKKSGTLDAILKESGEEFSAIFGAVSKKGAIFNVAPKNAQDLSNKNFGQTLYNIIISRKYPKFTRALLGVNISGVNDWSYYALGLNELENGELKKALVYFEGASKNASFKLMRDKADFWRYKIVEVTGDSAKSNEILRDLAQSASFNLYSLYAVKKTNATPKYQIIDWKNEIFTSAKQNKTAPLDISDPFVWQSVRAEIVATKDKDALLNVAKRFYHSESAPHLAFVLNRYFGFQKSIFIKPYKDKLEFDDENLVYAVARQESAFIPAVISRSYALGMMQIMPANVHNFAKAMGVENITYEDMFDAKTSLKFGNYYLAHLKKEFSHPLFVSYAYNGGPTFIRAFLKDEKNFSAKNKFDPWLSMEFIPFEESRFYAFSVMANYIAYRELEGERIDMDEFFKKAVR